MENLKRLPHSDRSLIIRAIFGGYSLPESVPGYYSTSTVQNLNELLANCAAGRCRPAPPCKDRRSALLPDNLL